MLLLNRHKRHLRERHVRVSTTFVSGRGAGLHASSSPHIAKNTARLRFNSRRLRINPNRPITTAHLPGKTSKPDNTLNPLAELKRKLASIFPSTNSPRPDQNDPVGTRASFCRIAQLHSARLRRSPRCMPSASWRRTCTCVAALAAPHVTPPERSFYPCTRSCA